MQVYKLLDDKRSNKKDIIYGLKGELVYCISPSGHVWIVEKVIKTLNGYKETGLKFPILREKLQAI